MIDQATAGRRLLILGGGLWQVEYVRRARRLGIETWVTDWSQTAMARADADHFEPIDLKDREATLTLARTARVDGVLTAADIGVPTAAFVTERLGLPGHSPALARLATNKLEMRQHSESVGIACPRYRCVQTVPDGQRAAEDLGPPVIVKPVDNCSSRGVRWVSRSADVAGAVTAALVASRSGQALIEQFLVGDEGSIEALVQDGRVTILAVCDKTKSPLPHRFDLELRYPGDYDEGTKRQIDSLAERIVAEFGVTTGILHIEFLVDRETRRVYLTEFAIRGCGSKVATHLVPALTGIDVVAVVIRQALGLATPIERSRALHGALHFLMFPLGRVVAVTGVDQAKRLPGVIDACVERAAGDMINEVHDGRSRPGHMLVCGPDRTAVQRTIADGRALIRIDYEHARGVAALSMPDMHEATR